MCGGYADLPSTTFGSVRRIDGKLAAVIELTVRVAEI